MWASCTFCTSPKRIDCALKIYSLLRATFGMPAAWAAVSLLKILILHIIASCLACTLTGRPRHGYGSAVVATPCAPPPQETRTGKVGTKTTKGAKSWSHRSCSGLDWIGKTRTEPKYNNIQSGFYQSRPVQSSPAFTVCQFCEGGFELVSAEGATS